MRKLLLSASLSVMSCMMVFAQSQADTHFTNGEVLQALQSYLATPDKESSDFISNQIGLCYYELSMPDKAISWFTKAKGVNPSIDNTIPHTACLMSLGKYKEAKSQLINYKGKYQSMAAQYIKSCNYALSASPTDYVINTMAQNEKGMDICPFVYDNNFLFGTELSRLKKDQMAAKLLQNKGGLSLGDASMNLWIKGQGATNQLLPCVINHNGTKIAYTTGFQPEFRTMGRHNTHLFVADYEPHTLVNPIQIDKNMVSCSDPFLNKEGNILYFSSNMEGGFGGYDLYYVTIDGDEISKPINLGEDVNTPGNEVSPSIDENNNLYFASDFHTGFGGYDLFTAQSFRGMWINVNNLGLGINSSMDEVYPSVSQDGVLYFSSNRFTGVGKYDIYFTELPNRNITFHVGSHNEVAAITNTNIEETQPSATNTNTDITTIPTPIIVVGEEEEVTKRETTKGWDEVFVDTDIQDVPEAVFVGDYKPRSIPSVELLANNTPQIAMTRKTNIDMAITPMTYTPKAEIVDLTPPPAFKIPDFTQQHKASNVDATAVSYEGARLVSIGEVITKPVSNVYFIQVAALFNNSSDYSKYKKLSSIGNVYKVTVGRAQKIRVGYYYEHNDAVQILTQVRSLGFRDAFLVNDDLNTASIELIASKYIDTSKAASDRSYDNTINSKATEGKGNFEYNVPLEKSAGAQYKVRLASYEDPIWFDSSKIKDLGQLEQWSKGAWTIFILSGFNTFEEANQARMIAVNRGYADAEVVIDNQGIIERIKKN